MTLQSTRTSALLKVSADTYAEIAQKLYDAGYGHVFGEDGAIDMDGIGLLPESWEEPVVRVPGFGGRLGVASQ